MGSFLQVVNNNVLLGKIKNVWLLSCKSGSLHTKINSSAVFGANHMVDPAYSINYLVYLELISFLLVIISTCGEFTSSNSKFTSVQPVAKKSESIQV